MGDNGADDGILELGLVQVDDDVDPLAADELRERVTGLLGQRAVRAAGPAAVEVADVHVGEVLFGGIVDEDFRVRPLVQRIRPAVADAELLASPGVGMA